MEGSGQHHKPESDRETLLEVYRQLMESQRDNTRIAYSWIGNVFLVLTSALMLFGLSTTDFPSFIPAMALGIGLSLIWAILTEVFAAYTRERFRQAGELESQMNVVGPALYGANRFKRLGWRQRFVQARTYVWMFVILNLGVWVLALLMKF